jgi:hypothetical protein
VTKTVDVGMHECVTCTRCATTYARVHPACPSCSMETRLGTLGELLDEIHTSVQGEAVDDALAYVEMRAALLDNDPLEVLADVVTEVRSHFNTNAAERGTRRV